jgi:site-specific recombinase XerD
MKTIQGTINSFLSMAAINSTHTGRAYKAALRHHFLTYLQEVHELAANCPPEDLTLEHARQFAIWLAEHTGKTGQPLSDASRALYLSALTRYYRYLLGNNLLVNVNSTTFEILRTDLARGAKRELPPLGQRLPRQQFVEALVTAAEQLPSITEKAGTGQKRRLMLTWRRNLAIVLTLKNTGVRSAELVGLCRRDLDHVDQGAWVKGKGKKTRFVPFDNQTWRAILVYLEQRQDDELMTNLAALPLFCRHDKRAGTQTRLPLATRAIRYIIHDLAEEAGILEKFNLTPHTLRHYFATLFQKEQGNLAVTQDILGHASPITTRRYAETNKEQIIEAYGQVYDRD